MSKLACKKVISPANATLQFKTFLLSNSDAIPKYTPTLSFKSRTNQPLTRQYAYNQRFKYKEDILDLLQ